MSSQKLHLANLASKVLEITNSTFRRSHVWLSLIATPFIIFGMTSIELYLSNRADLDNRAIVLLPFLLIILLLAAVGYVLYRYRNRHSLIKALLMVYYAAGPVFFLYTFVQQASLGFMVKATLLLAALVAISWYMYNHLKVEKIANVFAWLALALIAGQLVIAANSLNLFGFVSSNNFGSEEEISREGRAQDDLPNIYHIVLDEYQTDMFELTLTDEVKEGLGGFVYYPENTTAYGRTGMSLPTFFTGRSYDYNRPQIEYQKEAFSSDKSFLYWLKEAGYKTQALSHKIYTFDLPLFDKVVEHNDNTQVSPESRVYTRLFTDLWLYANTPRVVSKQLTDPEFLQQLEAQNVLAATAPALSYESFTNFIQDENTRDASGAYHYVHLILPHFPYVLNPDCSYQGEQETLPLAQSKCATRLITDFMSILKDLDRYDDSMIIIQADHGAKFEVENDELVSLGNKHYSEEWSLARSRALLLIKTPDRDQADPLHTSNAKTTLFDITPTIAESIGLDTELAMEGFSLVDPNVSIPERVRHYHFFEKKGKNELTDEMHRFIIEDGKARFDRVVPVGE